MSIAYVHNWIFLFLNSKKDHAPPELLWIHVFEWQVVFADKIWASVQWQDLLIMQCEQGDEGHSSICCVVQLFKDRSEL